MSHLLTRIEEAVFKVNVEHLGAGLNLLARYLEGFLIFLLLDEAEKLA